MEILQATALDLPLLVPMFDLYRIFYHQESNQEEVRSFLEDRFLKKDSKIFIAKLDDGKGVGFVQLYPTFSSIGLRRAWILNDLYVLADHRRSGVGERLIEHAVKFGKESGAKYLQLQTAVDNYSAQRLYSRLGWTKNEKFLVYNFGLI